MVNSKMKGYIISIYLLFILGILLFINFPITKDVSAEGSTTRSDNKDWFTVWENMSNMGASANGVDTHNDHTVIVCQSGNITKRDATTGKFLWSTTFGGDVASNVAFDSNHNFLVIGRVSTGGGNYRWYLEYFNGSTNSLIWSKETEILGNDVYSSACTFDNDGFIIVAGRGGVWYPSVAKFYTINGSMIWSYDDYDGSDRSPNFGEVCVDSTNNIIAVGRIQGSHYRAKIVKLDSTGQVLWSKTPGSENSHGGSVDVDAEDNILVGLGESDDADYNLFKYSSSGDLLWQNNDFGSDVNLYHIQQSIASFDNNKWIVGGRTNDGKYDMIYYLLDKDGEVIDNKRIDLGNDEYIRQIEYDPVTKRATLLGVSDDKTWSSVIRFNGGGTTSNTTKIYDLNVFGVVHSEETSDKSLTSKIQPDPGVSPGTIENYMFEVTNGGNTPDDVKINLSLVDEVWSDWESVFIGITNTEEYLTELEDWDFSERLDMSMHTDPVGFINNNPSINVHELIIKLDQDQRIWIKLQITIPRDVGTDEEYRFNLHSESTDLDGVLLDENQDDNDVLLVLKIVLPDLEVEKIRYPDKMEDGEIVTISIIVKNSGNISANKVKVTFYVNDKELKTQTISRFEKNMERLIPFTWEVADDKQKLTIKVDPEDTIVEKNEENNENTKNVLISDGRVIDIDNDNENGSKNSDDGKDDKNVKKTDPNIIFYIAIVIVIIILFILLFLFVYMKKSKQEQNVDTQKFQDTQYSQTQIKHQYPPLQQSSQPVKQSTQYPCSYCQQPLTYVEQYKAWYCDYCRKYI